MAAARSSNRPGNGIGCLQVNQKLETAYKPTTNTPQPPPLRRRCMVQIAKALAKAIIAPQTPPQGRNYSALLAT